jgi:hypothetical protein
MESRLVVASHKLAGPSGGLGTVNDLALGRAAYHSSISSFYSRAVETVTNADLILVPLTRREDFRCRLPMQIVFGS